MTSKTTLLENGLVNFPPNVHGIYIEPQDSGDVCLRVRQNDIQLSFVLGKSEREHLAALLLREDH